MSQGGVRDWGLLLRLLHTKPHLRHLSLQGNPEDPWRWDPRTLLISQLKTVTSLYLHEAPAEILHRIPDAMPHLTVLWCEGVLFNAGDQCVDFGRLRGMTRLTELCVHSPDPFQLPAFSFQGSVSQLKSLSLLTTLVISNVEGQVSSEFTFLRQLRRLTSLTVGFCFEWTCETYEAIGELKELRYLSLNGLPIKMEDAGLDSALVSCLTTLPHLEALELIDYFIPEG